MTQPEPTVDPDLPPGARQRLFSPVTATLICGHRDAILVDALLTLDQAHRLVDWIAAHGKNLTSVYITHAHGDHWFGLSAILDRYPAARALTLPAALDQMHRLNTPEIVAAFWETRFPGKLPDKLMFPEPLASQILELKGVRVASGKFWSDIAGRGYVRSADGCWSRLLRFVRVCPCTVGWSRWRRGCSPRSSGSSCARFLTSAGTT